MNFFTQQKSWKTKLCFHLDSKICPSKVKHTLNFRFFFSTRFRLCFLESVFDSSIQPNNWHELYTFVRDVRNQLTRSRPFINDDHAIEQIHEFQPRNSSDENLSISNHDHSSASSTVSSDEFEQSLTSTNLASFGTIKDELQYHFFGLLGSLDSLKTMADRVTEKYRDDSTFKI